MRRSASVPAILLLGPLLLAGCATHVGNPADGMGGFLGDVFSLRGNPNRPQVDSPNVRRVMGAVVEVEPLQPEPGNVWPGPLPPAKTIADLQREAGVLVPADPPPRAAPATPPSAAAAVAQPRGRVLQTPAGPAVTTVGANGVETYSLPDGRSGIVMPNANGSLTLIGPDGTTQTVPAPR